MRTMWEEKIYEGGSYRRIFATNYIDNEAALRQDFALSAAGKKLLAKIKAIRLGDVVPFNPTEAEPGLYGVVSTFLEAAGGDVDFAMPFGLPPLSAEDIAVVHDEVERLFIHVHDKDLHLNTDTDPSHQQDWGVRMHSGLQKFEPNEELGKLFIQQTLLPANKLSQDISMYWAVHDGVGFLAVTHNGLQATKLESMGTTFKLANDEEIKKPREDSTGALCQETGKIRQCAFKNIALNISECPSCKTATLDIELRTAKDLQTKPPASLVTLKLDGKRFDFAMQCLTEHPADTARVTYSCYLHDAWRIGEVVTQMLNDPDSPLYSDYLSLVAITRHMLKQLGYTEQP